MTHGMHVFFENPDRWELFKRERPATTTRDEVDCSTSRPTTTKRWRRRPRGGVCGKNAVSAFYDAHIGPNQLTITREEMFPSSSPAEIAYILVLHTRFPNGFTATVRGAFTYRVDDAGMITNLRGYWHMDAMTFAQEGES